MGEGRKYHWGPPDTQAGGRKYKTTAVMLSAEEPKLTCARARLAAISSSEHFWPDKDRAAVSILSGSWMKAATSSNFQLSQIPSEHSEMERGLPATGPPTAASKSTKKMSGVCLRDTFETHTT